MHNLSATLPVVGVVVVVVVMDGAIFVHLTIHNKISQNMSFQLILINNRHSGHGHVKLFIYMNQLEFRVNQRWTP